MSSAINFYQIGEIEISREGLSTASSESRLEGNNQDHNNGNESKLVIKTKLVSNEYPRPNEAVIIQGNDVKYQSEGELSSTHTVESKKKGPIVKVKKNKRRGDLNLSDFTELPQYATEDDQKIHIDENKNFYATFSQKELIEITENNNVTLTHTHNGKRNILNEIKPPNPIQNDKTTFSCGKCSKIIQIKLGFVEDFTSRLFLKIMGRGDFQAYYSHKWLMKRAKKKYVCSFDIAMDHSIKWNWDKTCYLDFLIQFDSLHFHYSVDQNEVPSSLSMFFRDKKHLKFLRVFLKWYSLQHFKLKANLIDRKDLQLDLSRLSHLVYCRYEEWLNKTKEESGKSYEKPKKE